MSRRPDWMACPSLSSSAGRWWWEEEEEDRDDAGSTRIPD